MLSLCVYLLLLFFFLVCIFIGEGGPLKTKAPCCYSPHLILLYFMLKHRPLPLLYYCFSNLEEGGGGGLSLLPYLLHITLEST